MNATLAVQASNTNNSVWSSGSVADLLAVTGTFASGANLGVDVAASDTFTYADDLAAACPGKGLVKFGSGTMTLTGTKHIHWRRRSQRRRSRR